MVGKIVGGFLGLMSGGFLGALLGLWIGHWFDRAFLGSSPGGGIFGGTNRNDQREILTLCFELLGCVCKADGQVTRAEIDSAEALMTRLRVQADQRQDLVKAFNRGKANGFDVDACARRLRELCKGRVLWTRLALEIVLTGALADGRIDDAEREVLARIAGALGFRSADFEALLRLMTGTAGHGFGGFGGQQGSSHSAGGFRPPPTQDRLGDAYKALGVSKDTSDADVRKAYRRLMSQHHPDKLAAQDMPDALRAQAEERVRQIRDAWDIIKEARGI